MSNTREKTSTEPDEQAHTDEQIDATIAFFNRVGAVYGKSKAETLVGKSEEALKAVRLEWIELVGNLRAEHVDYIFHRLKIKLANEDPYFFWPDVGRILGLLKENKRSGAHKEFDKGLPEPEWRKEQRLELGRLASRTCMAVMNGNACFLEDRPDEA